MTEQTSEDLTFEIVAEHVGVVTLSRPAARNALTHGMYAALEDAVRTAPARGVRCLVVTGADPAFCSGDDVRQAMTGTSVCNSASAAGVSLGARAEVPSTGALLSSPPPITWRCLLYTSPSPRDS